MCLNAAHMHMITLYHMFANKAKKRRIYTTLHGVGGRGDASMCKQMISCFNFKRDGSPTIIINML